MDEFDLIGPLAPLATYARAAEGTDEFVAAKEAHAKCAERTIASRAARNAPFVKRHEDFAPGFVATQPLLTAVNVALSLGRPLLLTGEPGSGKTLAAFWLAHLLDVGKVLEFHVKSDSRAQDLLYTFDAASWFRESQAAATRGELREVPKTPYLKAGPLGYAFGWKGQPEHPHVVLIDEIDKAPRDFPNDLLLELDQMRFRIPEDEDREVRCPVDKRPVVVITSNQERRLPDPFLRRCVQHEIKLDNHTIAKILTMRLQDVRSMAVPPADAEQQSIVKAEEELIEAALSLWRRLKEKRDLGRKYTVDEFWRWLALATYGRRSAVALRELAEAIEKGNLKHEALHSGTLFSDADLAALEVELKQAAAGAR